MKRYFMWKDINGEYHNNEFAVTYYEIKENYILRQLLLIDDRIIGSNIKDADYEYNLAEGEVSVRDILDFDGEVIEISKKDFERKWELHRNNHISKWRASKSCYPLGTRISGCLEIMYPQGILIRLDDETIAIADYDECLMNSPYDSLYPQYIVTGTINDFDDENMWIKLDNCHVEKK